MLILGLLILIFISAVSLNRINGIIIYRSAALILLYSLIISLDTLNVSIIGSGIGVYGGLYEITILTKIIEAFIYLIGALILSNQIITTNNLNLNLSEIKLEYPLIALLTVVGSILLINSNDLISMYLSIELQSFSLYVLATLYRDSESATSAGLKYFLLGGLSSCIILLGSAIIYSNLATTNLESIYLLISQDFNLISFDKSFLFEKNYINYSHIGLVIMTIGFLFKIAAAPLHNWSPDVYDGVPTKVTIWLAVMAKLSILTFLLDLVINSQNLIEQSNPLTKILLFSSLLSLIIGTVVGLVQQRIKRLLAYSTISHLGFILLALAINQIDSTESFIFYLIQYSLTSANGFIILLAIGSLALFYNDKKGLNLTNLTNDDYNQEKEYSAIQYITQLKGIYYLNRPYPLLGLSFAIILFSMAGIPPLVGFFAKQAVLLSAVKNGYMFIALIAILASVISAAYYLKIIKVMIFDKDINNDLNKLAILDENNNKNIRLTNLVSFTIALLTLLILLFIMKPILILNSVHVLALSSIYYN